MSQKIYQLEVVRVVKETHDAVTLHFPQAKTHRIWYQPGQFITLILNRKGETHYRSYSICTSLRLDDTMAITVKRVPGGKFSNYLNDEIQVGDEVAFLQPAGRFVIDNSVKYQRQIFLFAGGSGITPIFSILRSVLFNEPLSQVVLFYVSKSEEEIIFHEQLLELIQKFPIRLDVSFYLTQQKGSKGYHQGRITRTEIPQLVQNKIKDSFSERLFYVCGPIGMMEEIETGLKDMNIDTSKIHKENFFVEKDIQPASDPSRPARSISVTYGNETHEFTVPPGAKILPTALIKDILLPFSCLKGNCATCMGKVLEGEVIMVRNEGLTDDEVADGYVLVCQAKPVGEGVKIRMGR